MDDAERALVIDHVTRAATAAHDAECASGMTSEFRSPVATIIEERRDGARLIVTTCATYRVYHYAQSGSDWSIQTVTIDETTVEGGAITGQRRLLAKTVNLTEGRSDDHDDELEAREIVAAWRHHNS
jgi:hypothetical protein